MDGGVVEKGVTKATLDAVRETTTRNRHRRMRRSQNLSDPTPYNVSCVPPGDTARPCALPVGVEHDVEDYDASLEDTVCIAYPLLPTAPDFIMFPEESNLAYLQRTVVPPSAPDNANVTDNIGNLPREPFSSHHELGDESASLVMEYIDSIFFFQFPLYSPLPTKGGRGWLLWFLVHVRPLQNITAALCAQHYHSLLPESDRSSFDATQETGAQDRLSPLLSELNRYIGQVDREDKDVWEGKTNILACTVQLVYLEIFQGGSLKWWRTHLEAASNLIKVLTIEKFNGQDTNLLHSTAYINAFKFFAGLFIWFDVMSAASMGTKHLVQDEDERLLETDVVDLGTLVGCENWIAVTILKTSALHHWKGERKLSGKLSFAELVRRSEALEKRLKQSLTGLSTVIYRSAATSSLSATHGDPQSKDIVTAIFVGSALTYLHFVVSGAYPELQEIRESVKFTLEAFKKLPHMWLLRSLAWPFCVTGCFALPDERDTVRNLVSAAGVNRNTAGNLWKAMEVVEQCWKLQESSPGPWDWMQAANSLGYDALFI